jgi:hypothetical protein
VLGRGWQVHVVPVNDRRSHDASFGCWCEPRIERDLVIHNSADRREFDEPPRKPVIED